MSLSYGPSRRADAARRPTPYARSSGGGAGLWNRIISSVSGLFSGGVSGLDTEPEPSPQPVSTPPSPPAPPSFAPASEGLSGKRALEPSSVTRWNGQNIADMDYGELRRACSENGLNTVHDRASMQAALERHVASLQNTDGHKKRRVDSSAEVGEPLDSAMLKKAKVGFSRVEFDRYMSLMKENLVDDAVDDGFGSQTIPVTADGVEGAVTGRRRSSVIPPSKLLSRRPARRDSLSGSHGPIHLTFPTVEVTASDVNNLCQSRTARQTPASETRSVHAAEDTCPSSARHTRASKANLYLTETCSSRT
ncbi:unnamed protein product (mitochondrion) [Plasmodiophora brassicae]|uniref:Uncharacterized protein n=1 Tax=Plasmodiophora brassicae TaxID=37360 RepID=A0A3P3YJ47_PLABS|nr:unnamed protein product [Plasmodiophora brassicae]